MTTNLCKAENTLFDPEKFCAGTTQKRGTYTCRSVQCRSKRPKSGLREFKYVISRLEFRNGFELLKENDAAGLIRRVYESYRAQGKVQSFVQFLQYPETFLICRRHKSLVPFQFLRELESLRETSSNERGPTMQQKINTDISLTGGQWNVGSDVNLRTNSSTGLSGTTEQGPTRNMRKEREILDLVNKLKSVEQSIFANAKEGAVGDFFHREPQTLDDISLAIEKLKKFLRGEYADYSI